MYSAVTAVCNSADTGTPSTWGAPALSAPVLKTISPTAFNSKVTKDTRPLNLFTSHC